MKIAFIVPSLIKSGPIKVVQQLAHGLASEHTVAIFYLENRKDRELLSFNVPTIKVSWFSSSNLVNFDIVHSHTIKADLFVRFHRKKFHKAVTTLHNYADEDLLFSYGNIKGRALLQLWQWATARHDHIVVLSQHAQKYYRRLWGERPFSYIYNGVECPRGVEKFNQKQEAEKVHIGIIASAGGIDRRKGIDQVIRALVSLPHRYELHIVGKETQESRRLQALAKRLGVETRVSFHGYVHDISSFIANIDFFVMPSRSEGFGLAVQEIACMKKPIICSNIPIFREIFNNQEVRFFELENIDSLVHAIDGFENVGEAYAKRAYKRYLTSFTPQKMVKNYLNLYQKLLHG